MQTYYRRSPRSTDIDTGFLRSVTIFGGISDDWVAHGMSMNELVIIISINVTVAAVCGLA